MAEVLPESFLVRILRGGMPPVAAGIGTLVGRREVVTCAHVINAALGLDARSQEAPAEPVDVDFPLLPTSLDAPGSSLRRAVVVRWLPPPREGAAGDDLACLELVDESAPEGAIPARFIVSLPQAGHAVRLFGYPGDPPRPDGAWVASAVRGRVGGGLLQLDSGPDSALRVQPGFSGGPVFDDASGRVVGLLAAASGGRAATRDSYAVSADRLRLAWPEVLDLRRQQGGAARATGGRSGARVSELTVLHLSDTQYGREHLFGGNGLTSADRSHDTLFNRLHDDLSALADAHGLRPDLMIVTGDLAEWGLRSEFGQVSEFLAALCEAVEIPRRHVAIVPGNHDINRRACAAYFLECESEEETPAPPYWPKWRQFVSMLQEFYADTGVTFTPDEPWTLFEMPELSVVVAGLNSTMAESHRDDDHYGWIGEHQLRWFAGRLARYRARGWLRLAAVHHNAVRGAVLDDENLRDADDLDQLIGTRGLANLLLHGHTHDGRLQRLPSGLPVLSTGSAAVKAEARPAEVPNQYQLITVRRDGFTQHARQYVVGQRRWIGDNRINPAGSDWRTGHFHEFSDVDAALPPPGDQAGPGTEPRTKNDDPLPGEPSSPREHFIERVAEATQTRFPGATVTIRREPGYLRVSSPLPGGGAEQWPVGVAEGEADQGLLDRFLDVHAQFASADPSVPSEFVHGGPPAGEELIAYARKGGVRLRSFVDYQGLIDLRPLIDKQRERLASDQLYPARHYIPQRYRLQDAQPDDIRTGLIERAVSWLSEENSRFIMVLGDFGRGKTAFLRQLTRSIPAELPAAQPVLVELRSLEKGPGVDDLLAQHLFRQGVEDISPAKLRYMIRSGRLVLLFDGFDELELRVGYDHAAEYLSVLLGSVAERGKVVLTSRTQHFQSDSQVRTALGQRVAAIGGSRIVVLEDFSDEQVLQYLSAMYDGDTSRAKARFDLLDDIEDLLGLARNPRMLSFITALDDERLLAIHRHEGKVSAAELYREIVTYWLSGEAERQAHKRGLPSLSDAERLTACTALALRLWESVNPTIGLADLSAEVSATLTQLAERGFTGDQASHSIGSGSLLVRTEEGTFAFIHQSIMEWLIADAASQALSGSGTAPILTSRRMSRLMIEFFIDLAGHGAARRWATEMLADPECTESAKQNALGIHERLASRHRRGAAGHPAEQLNLSGVDLRDQDLSGQDLRGAVLRRADLRGMRLEDTDLSEADLREADLTGTRMVRGSLQGAVLDGSHWDRAALLGTEGLDDLTQGRELRNAAVIGRDPVDFMVQSPRSTASSIGFSPDGTLLAVAYGNAAEIVDVTSERTIRKLSGHTGEVRAVAFSPDGALVATASADGTARVWDVAAGTARVTLQGHDSGVLGVVFSPDGALVATGSQDGTARVWDVAAGTARVTLQGHGDWVRGVAFSPDGALVATASDDGTARVWDLAAGTARVALQGHGGWVRGVAFSPDGALVATASDDFTARVWDLAAGTARATLQGHDGPVLGVAFSPDGALVATGSQDGTARVWDVAAGTARVALQGHGGRVWGVAFSPDGALVATASADGRARVWDVAAGTARVALQGHDSGVLGVAFSPDGALVATASADGRARVWDVAAGTARPTLQGHDGAVLGVAFSPDGALVATASADGRARVWDVAAGTARVALQGHDSGVLGVAFSPDGALVATASADGRARVWDVAAGTARPTLQGHDGAVWGVAFSPDGALVATASDDFTARVWDVAAGTVRATLRHGGAVWGVAFSPDGALVATASDDFTARVWDVAARTARATLRHGGAVRGVAFSPDGALVATASDDRTARVWDVAAGTARATLQGHDGAVRGVAFSPDGALVATASDDGTARIWDVATGASRTVLIPLDDGGYATIADEGYKLQGDAHGRFWWVAKLCRFEPGELDSFVPGLTRRATTHRFFSTSGEPARPGPA